MVISQSNKILVRNQAVVATTVSRSYLDLVRTKRPPLVAIAPSYIKYNR